MRKADRRAKLRPFSSAWGGVWLWASALALIPPIVLSLQDWDSTGSRFTAVTDDGAGRLEGRSAASARLARGIRLRQAGSSASGATEGVADADLHALARGAEPGGSDDPFLRAYAAGIREGSLDLLRTEGYIPVLGPPASARNTCGNVDLLRSLQGSVGGSFRRFFANVFSGRKESVDRLAMDFAELSDLAEAHEDNPFAKAREALAERQAPAGQPEPAGKAEPTATSDSTTPQPPAPNASESTAAPQPARVPPTVTVRPNLMLRVDDDGALQSIPFSRPGEGRFESAQLGVLDYSTLLFQDAAEFPMATGVADFNGDGEADVVLHVTGQSYLRFFYGQKDGTYSEGLRVEIGRDDRSLAAADFNGDGRVDLAVSQIGIGSVIVLYSDGLGSYRFRSFWTDGYRDYIAAADTGSGSTDIIGMNYAGCASVLIDFSRDGGVLSGKTFAYTPSLETELSTARGFNAQVNAVLLSGGLSVNLGNRAGRLVNVMNVARGSDIFVALGDIDTAGSMTVGIARPRP